MSAVDRLLATAAAEVGYLKKVSNAQIDDKTANAGSANYTKYARDLDKLGMYHAGKQGLAWCDIFVDWCFVRAFGLDLALKMTGQPLKGYGAGCTESANYYKQMGRFHKTGPQPGDQIFFASSSGSGMTHTGIVERVTDSLVYTIEGNTSGANGVIANGGGVCRKSYQLAYSKIGGYGRPNFDLAKEADGMDEMEAARNWATANGLILGDGTAVNGEPNYLWQAQPTREQLVTVLYRFARLMGKA